MSDQLENRSDQARRELAEILKKSRDNKGLSIEGVAQTTRINPEFVVAFETGDYTKLPGEVFARGFLKNIAACLGIEQTHVLGLYQTACNAVPAPEVVEKVHTRSQVHQDDSQTNERSAIQVKWVGAGLVATAVALSVIVWVNNSADRVSDSRAPIAVSPAKSVSAKKAPQLAEEQQNEVSVDKPDEGFSQKALESSPQMSSSDAGLTQKLELEVRERVKLKIKLDAGSYEVKNLIPGSYSYDFANQAELLIYNAANVMVSYNQRPLGSLGSSGRIRRISFSRDLTKDKLY